MSRDNQDFSENLSRAFEMPRDGAGSSADDAREQELDEILHAARHEALGHDFGDRTF